jgi:hypothetical protein
VPPCGANHQDHDGAISPPPISVVELSSARSISERIGKRADVAVIERESWR